MKKRKMKRTKVKESKGLGDTIEKFTEATGIKKVVEWIAGEDCGCDERKEKMNRLFKYDRPECLEESEHSYLDKFFKEHRGVIKPETQDELITIYNRVFKKKKVRTSCGSCVRSMIGELQKVFKTYGNK
ncbi:MAG: hypothetical protein Unbinned5607contig1000_59 [Prokaryotic dsDNA virus sp.]|nr:MAG: hypothetical protein Unbinned5607contig1000_59 [Prokaryotic dsDNA virus sp.]|tara:strand:+ start:26061 stop:26447 length:387 start_codon:yes stop_codon:yes gene_type:complete